MIIERGVTEVLWTCGDCEKTNDLTCPIWEDKYGTYLAIECPDCLSVAYVANDDSEVVTQ